MKFESKYNIGELVEYKQDRNDESNLFGFVVEVTFYKPTAGAPAVSYKIEKCNDKTIDPGIYEHNIVKVFQPT